MIRKSSALYLELLATVGVFAIPLTIVSAAKVFHPDGAAPADDGVQWHFAHHTVWSALMIVMLGHVIRLNDERVSDFTQPFTKWTIPSGIGLWVLFWLVYVLFSRIALELLPSERLVGDSRNVEFLRAPLGPFYLMSMILNPFCEEFFMRGFLQTRLRQLQWDAPSIIVASAMLQAAYHLYQGLLPAAALGLGFMILAWYYHRSRKLWPVVVAHLIMDVGGALQYSR